MDKELREAFKSIKGYVKYHDDERELQDGGYTHYFTHKHKEEFGIIERALKNKKNLETEITEVLVNFDKDFYSNPADAIIEIRKILDKYE